MAVVHRIYARALHQAAKEAGRLDRVREDFASFAAAAEQVAELRALLVNPEIDPRARASALGQLLGESDELFRNFLLTVADKGRAGEIADIHEEFERFVSEEEGRLDVELTTAIELSDVDLGRIVGRIEQATGRKVEASRRVDPDLIGGVILQVGSLRLDASLRGRLTRLRQELASARS